eukprot:SAG25_NODE_1035_length_4213_cov_1.593097_2_plen_56_part_00
MAPPGFSLVAHLSLDLPKVAAYLQASGTASLPVPVGGDASCVIHTDDDHTTQGGI